MFLAAFVLMQFIISAKAGLVNAVEGMASVRLQEQVPAGSPIQTGLAGRVEILLNPASFLRLGENSEAVLDSVELTNVAVRIVSGSAIIESTGVEKSSSIRVTSGALTVLVAAPGLYRFSENTAFVLDGELRTQDSSHSINRGRQITASVGDQAVSYEEAAIHSTDQVTTLDQWSQYRSQEIASANSRSSETNSASNSLRPAYSTPFLYPGGIPSYGLGSRIVPSMTPFSFFQWYNGGYSFYQPLLPSPPAFIYPPFYIGPVRPILHPSPTLSRPPATTPFHPAPRPIPSRPGGGIARGHR